MRAVSATTPASKGGPLAAMISDDTLGAIHPMSSTVMDATPRLADEPGSAGSAGDATRHGEVDHLLVALETARCDEVEHSLGRRDLAGLRRWAAAEQPP